MLVDQHSAEEVVILQRVGDVPAASESKLVLVDIAFETAVSGAADSLREVRVIPHSISRSALLHALGVQSRCSTPGQGDSCQVFVNNALWAQTSAAVRRFEHADYLRVVVPQQQLSATSTISTKRKVTQCSTDDSSPHPKERRTDRSFSSHGNEGGDTSSWLQMYTETPTECATRRSTHALRSHSATFPSLASTHPTAGGSTAQRQRPVQIASRQWMPQARMAFRLQATVQHPDDGLELPMTTWFLHHSRYPRNSESRDIRLDIWSHLWYHDLCDLWQDAMDPFLPVRVFFVHPTPPTDSHRATQGHLILLQGHDDRVPVLLSALFDHDFHRRVWHLAALVPAFPELRDLQDILAIQRWCSRRICQVHAGGQIVLHDVLPQVADGESIVITITQVPLQTEEDDVNLMQVTGPRIPELLLDDADGLARSEDRLSELPDGPAHALVSSPRLIDHRWKHDLLDAFHHDAVVECEEEGQVLYVWTWFINHERFPICSAPRVVRLPSSPAQWLQSLLAPWASVLENNVLTDVRVVHSRPPHDMLRMETVHLMIEQRPREAVAAAVISVLYHEGQGERLHQQARSLPRWICTNDLIDNMHLNPICDVQRCTARAGRIPFRHYIRDDIPSGISIEIHVRPTHCEADPSAASSNQDFVPRRVLPVQGPMMMQIARRWHRASRTSAPVVGPRPVGHNAHEIHCIPQRIAAHASPDRALQPIVFPAWPTTWTSLHEVWSFYFQQAEMPDELVIRAAVWYSDHVRRPWSDDSRTVALGSNLDLWVPQIVAAWEDWILPDRPFELVVVRPVPLGANENTHFHVVLIQQPQQFTKSVILAVMDAFSDPWQTEHVCLTVPNVIDHWALLHAAVVDFQCPPTVPETRCTTSFGNTDLTAGNLFPVQHGMCFTVIVEGSPEPVILPAQEQDAADATHDLDGHGVSLLQLRLQFHEVHRRTQVVGLQTESLQKVFSNVLNDKFAVEPDLPAWHVENCQDVSKAYAEGPTTEDVPSHVRPIQLSLDQLIPNTEVVKLKAAVQEQILPTYVEIMRNTSEQGAQLELQHWGSNCTVYRFGLRDEYLCIDPQHPVATDNIHYLLCHDDLADEEGSILHSSTSVLTTNDLMKLLYQLQYTRAVIISEEELTPCWRRIRFLNCQPAQQQDHTKPRLRTPWPAPHGQHWEQRPLYDLDAVQELDPQISCIVRTPFTKDDLIELTQAAIDVLCTDFSGHDLPDFIAEALLQHGVGDLHDNWDRWLIFTDGSSQTKHKHHTPEYADAMHQPDTWAMLLLGEKYEVNGTNKIVPIGWMSHPVRTDPQGACYVGAQRVGADVAEREGLIWSGLWRMAQDCVTPTLFCVDSQVTGEQAMGQTGALEPDLSYRLLRGVFQCLQLGLPPTHVGVHHVRSHTGDPYNEFVDLIAKREAVQSFNLPRLKLDMRKWNEKIPHLWLRFGEHCGLPQWHNGFDVPPPELPPARQPSTTTNPSSSADTVMLCQLSLATMNVCSLSKGPDGHAGKLRYLYEQVKAHGLNIVGVQEGRNEALQSTSHGICRLCAGHQDGQYGVELWVNLQQPIAHDPRGRPVFLQPHHFQVTHCDLQRLIVRCSMETLSLWILVAHAPHSGKSAQDRSTWWTTTQDLIDAFSDGVPWIWLIDANAAPGEADQRTVFRDMPISRSTDLFRQCLAANELCLPATMECHIGTRSTWTSLDGQSEHCIDHIAIPQTWAAFCTYSGILDMLDLGNFHDDHCAVGLQIAWRTHATICRKREATVKLAWDAPEVRRALKDHLDCPSNQRWTEDVESQASSFAQKLHVALASCPRLGHSAKKPYITDQLWSLRAHKVKMKKRLTDVNRALYRQTLQCVFRAWREKHSSSFREEHDAYKITLLCGRLRLVAAHRSIAQRLRNGLRKAKQTHLEGRLDALDASTPAANILQCLRDFVGPTNVKMCKKKTVPLVHNQSGQPCCTPQEAQDTWIEFFRDMEGGRRISNQTLRDHWRHGLEDEQEERLDLCATSLPTLTDLEIALRRTARGKARGGDDIPGELLHFFPSELSPALYPALWKLLLHGQEDLSYKGGLLVQAYKGRGETHSCSSFRSLLISSQIGKALHRTVRTHQATIFEKFLQVNQVGGKRKMPVTYGLHQVRAHLRYAQRQSRCAAVVFIDLTEAFYRIFRPLCMHNDLTDEALAAFLHKLKMPESALHELWTLMDGPNALELANMPYHLRKGIAAIHRNTHFWMRHQTDVVETAFGSRPGDPFADVCFSYVWARVLRRLQDYMAAHDLLEVHPALPHLNLFDSFDIAMPEADSEQFLGPT